MNKEKKLKGFTLVELMMTVLISSIAVLTMAILLTDNLRGWRVMYERIHSQEADNTYVTRLLFDKAVRKSSSDPNNIKITNNFSDLTVYYYSDNIKSPTKTPPDSYASFTYNGSNTLTVSDNGPSGAISSWTIPNIASNGCTFKQSGRALEMLLILNNPNNPADNKPQSFSVFSSAFLHSQ